MKLYIVGLGAGDINHITSSAREIITNQSAMPVFIRTQIHPIVNTLEQEYMTNYGQVPEFHYMDKYYEEKEDFEKVYENITKEVIENLKKYENLVYCTPGNPFVAEITTNKIIDEAKKLGSEIITIPSVSLIDAILTALKIDPCEHLTIQDALSLKTVDPKFNHIITQVYNREIASQIKLTLMEDLDEDQEVYIVKAAGIKSMEDIKKVKLYTLDYQENTFDHLTSLYIPKSENYPINNYQDLMEKIDPSENPKEEIENLKENLDQLQKSIDNEDIQNQIDTLANIYKNIGKITKNLEKNGEYDLKEVINTATKM